MIKLCGFAVSNYHNKVKLALLEKGVPFEEETVFPSQNEEFLRRSPMGKVPFIETEGGSFAESQVLIEYIEDAFPNPPLYPRDPLQRAKVREIIQIIELHLELPARTLFPEVFFGGAVSDETKKRAASALRKGAAALARVAKFAPYIAGDTFTYADCAAVFHLPVVGRASEKSLGQDALKALPIRPYVEMMKQRPNVQKVDATRAAGMQQFMEYVSKK